MALGAMAVSKRPGAWGWWPGARLVHALVDKLDVHLGRDDVDASAAEQLARLGRVNVGRLREANDLEGWRQGLRRRGGVRVLDDRLEERLEEGEELAHLQEGVSEKQSEAIRSNQKKERNSPTCNSPSPLVSHRKSSVLIFSAGGSGRSVS